MATHTYSGNPASSDRDAARFYAQDTNSDRWLLSDEEYDYLISKWLPAYSSPIYVAALACEVIAAKYAGYADVAADGVTVSLSSLSERYDVLAGSLRDQYKAASAGGAPWDASTVDDALAHDDSIPDLVFGIGFQDNFDAGRQDYGGRGHTRPGARPETVATEG